MMIAGIAIMKKAWTEIKKSSVQLFQGEITVSKRECWMAGAILVLTGIALGLVHAPLTHGVNISLFSNNGSGNGNNNKGSLENNGTGSLSEDGKAVLADAKNEISKSDAVKARRKRSRKNSRKKSWKKKGA